MAVVALSDALLCVQERRRSRHRERQGKQDLFSPAPPAPDGLTLSFVQVEMHRSFRPGDIVLAKVVSFMFAEASG